MVSTVRAGSYVVCIGPYSSKVTVLRDNACYFVSICSYIENT